MATAPAPEPRRATALFLLALAGALQTLAGALALPQWLFLSLSGLAGLVLLGVLALRISAPRAWRVVTFLTALITLIAALAAICAVMAPSTAGGLLILLWLSWLVVLPIYLWLTLVERPTPASLRHGLRSDL